LQHTFGKTEDGMTERFDKAAKDWDKSDVRTQLSGGIGGAILEHVALEGSMHIMDFGAGTGLLSGHVAPKVAKISAVDISQGMLDELAAKPELEGKVLTRCRNILHDPLEEDFDGIVSAMALHHVEDTAELLRVFYDHLKPGGFVALADLDAEDGSFHRHGSEGVFHLGFKRDALKAQLEAAGFADIVFVTAHTVTREEGRQYPIFLVIAHR
jgi:2-polyprenyl-3-methyl-5-hydroxy-6-metoxy-1,4-benzoquinol methylase